MSLHVITDRNDPLCGLIKDDPVRSEIQLEYRVNDYAEILVSLNDSGEPTAAVCIKYCSIIPSTVEELLNDIGGNYAAIFYTIWSYANGAGGRLLFDARSHIEHTRPTITRFVTLSPQTSMARKFHIKNGAAILRENGDTINYEYGR